jgi:hypothetical protein
MYYFVVFLSCSFIVVMFVLARRQNRLLHRQEDVLGLPPLMLPVNCERMRDLFDPAQEWNLRAKNGTRGFKTIQANRRRLAIQYATHMYRNAGLYQRIGGAGLRSGNRDRVLMGKMLLDASVAVRMRSALLLVFLRFQQLVYTGSDMSAVRDIMKDLLPDYEHMLEVASDLSQALDPKLHRELIRVTLAPPSSL